MRPAALTPPGRIAVLAPSSPSGRDRIESAALRISDRGFDVVFASNLFDRVRDYLAGDDETRLREMNRFLADPSIDAFLFSRGGYGAMRIVDRIDFAALVANPRPLVGYSDITVIHQAAARAGVMTFHGPMLNSDFYDALSPEHEEWFWAMLAGQAPLVHHFQAGQVVAEGEAEGILFGGCLSLTVALADTPFDFWPDGGIWFWEDVAEPSYRIDRMLTHLRLSGRLNRLRGVITGKLKDCGNGHPEELHGLIDEMFGGLGIPVVRDFPFGHHADNLMLPVGARARLDTRRLTLTIPEAAVETKRR